MKTESEIIQDYLNGAEKSIIVCEDFFFILVRITGLGIAYRLDKDKLLQKLKDYPFALSAATNMLGIVNLKTALKEIVAAQGRDIAERLYMECVQRVDRDERAFSDLSLYNGLPILKNHPDNNEMLSYHNLQDNPIIGTIVRAFQQDNEIWGIAKIYDLSLLDALKNLSSTSPAIVSQWTFEKNDDIITAKESPIYLNHLAFVASGFWDKDKNNPKGYVADSYKINKESNMAEKDPNAATNEPTKTADSDDNATKTECSDSGDSTTKTAPQAPDTTAKTADSSTTQVAPAATAKTADNDDNGAREAIRKEVEAELRKELESQIRGELEAEYRKKAEAEANEKELEEEKQALLDSAQETALDRERWQLIAKFRDIVDTAPESVGAKMPYLGNERLNPSATISKILAVNEGLYNPKYAKAIDSAYSEGTYALQKDAFNNLIETIQQKTADAYKAAKIRDDGFRPTANPNVFVNPNF